MTLSISQWKDLFDQLLDSCRSQGFLIGVDQYVEVHDLLDQLHRGNAVPTEARLSTMVASLVCTTAREQDHFAREFKRLRPDKLKGIRRLRGRISPVAETPDSQDSGPRIPPVYGALVLIFSILLFFLSMSHRRLEVRVVDNAGKAVAGAQILVDQVNRGQTDAYGRFLLTQFEVGQSLVVINEDCTQAGKITASGLKKLVLDCSGISDIGVLPPIVIDLSPPPKEDLPTQRLRHGVERLNDILVTYFNFPKPEEPPPQKPEAWYQQWYRQSYPYLPTAVVVLTMGLFLLWYWFYWRRRIPILQKRATRHETTETQHRVKGDEARLFESPDLRSVMGRLGLHRREQGRRLDPEKTVHATIENLGLFTPKRKVMRVSPEYLILVDQASGEDQLAQLADLFIRRLEEAGIFFEHYYFSEDPRFLVARVSGQRVRLSDLSYRHEGHRLLLFSDGRGLVNAIDGRLRSWITLFETWPQRYLLTPQLHQGWREDLLTVSGFGVFPATEAGLCYMLGIHQDLPWPKSEAAGGLFPATFLDHEDRWFRRLAPHQTQVTEMVDVLKAYLGQSFHWLCACAVYPALNWHLTLHLGLNLRDGSGKPLLDEERLVTLLRLPWFRHGTIPDWVRLALLDALPKAREQEVRVLLRELLAARQREGFSLEISEEKIGTFREGPLRDRVFLRFVLGKPSRLSMAIPNVLARWLCPEGNRYLGFRPTVLFLLATLLSIGANFLPQPDIPVPPQRAEVIRPMELVVLKPGTFTMGSPEDEPGRYDNEVQRQVTLTKPFAMGKFEVTQAVYEKVIGENPSHFENAGPNAPVESVSWQNAMDFCDKLNEALKDQLPLGYKFSLPTEAQWEYACREEGQKTGPLYSGPMTTLGEANSPELGRIAWYRGNSGVTYAGGTDSSNWKEKEISHTRAGSHPVAQKRPNALGLFDMLGNVWERCSDYYDAYPDDAVTDPVGPETGGDRVVRGGSWYDDARYCRAADRRRGSPEFRNEGFGFRVALVQDKAWAEGRGPGSEVVWIEPGTFQMGSPTTEPGRGDDETLHTVTLTQRFAMGRYEVSQSLYEKVMGENPSKYKGPNRPVEQVSWEDARRFCEKLTELDRAWLPEGYVYDLPTEVQWEYATRAGTQTTYPFGNDVEELKNYAWYFGNSNSETTEVGALLPNNYGLYNTLGNVWEWCRDWYGSYEGDTVDPAGPPSGSDRVFRGGSWIDSAQFCRAASRIGVEPSGRGRFLGFRVALVERKESPRDEGDSL